MTGICLSIFEEAGKEFAEAMEVDADSLYVAFSQVKDGKGKKAPDAYWSGTRPTGPLRSVSITVAM